MFRTLRDAFKIPDLRKKLIKAGFKIESFRYWNFIALIPLLFTRLFNKRISEKSRYSRKGVHGLINKFLYHVLSLEKLIQVPIGASLIIVASKK